VDSRDQVRWHRTLIVIDRGRVRAFTRNGNDWTAAYRRVVDACSKLSCRAAVLDGEMVVQDEHGLTDFTALRSAIYTAPHRLVFFAASRSPGAGGGT
jgi:ATP-dependent DNA ligase